MDTDSWLLFGLLIMLIIGGGYFAASETAFASVNTVKIRQRAENGERRAINAQYVLDNFNKALSALLIGNNIMHIGTASLATFIVTKLWGEGYTGYSTIATTLVVFLVSEMVPKQYAKDRPESTALMFAGSLCVLMKVLGPVATVFDALAGLISNMFKAEQVPTVTEDELAEIIDSLADSEPDGEERSRLIHSALEFDDITAREIMTPVENIEGIEVSMDRSQVLEYIRDNKHSRLPVYIRSSGQIVGVLDVRSYIRSYISEPEKTSVRNLMQKPMIVPNTKRIDDLFDEMTQARTHMCVVADERRRTVGIITMEDILEELVGEIWDEDDIVPPKLGGEAEA